MCSALRTSAAPGGNLTAMDYRRCQEQDALKELSPVICSNPVANSFRNRLYHKYNLIVQTHFFSLEINCAGELIRTRPEMMANLGTFMNVD